MLFNKNTLSVKEFKFYPVTKSNNINYIITTFHYIIPNINGVFNLSLTVMTDVQVNSALQFSLMNFSADLLWLLTR